MGSAGSRVGSALFEPHRLAASAAAAAALALAGGLAVRACLGLAGTGLVLAVGAGVAAGVLLLVALAGAWPAGAVWAQALIAGLYVAVLSLDRRELDATAPAFAAGLLLTGELAFTARDLAGGRLVSASGVARRLLLIGAAGLATVVAGWLLLSTAAAPLPAGPATTVAGVLAAVAALGLVALAAHGRRAGPG